MNFTPNVLSVAVDAAQLIWVGAEKVGLFCLNALTDSFTYLGNRNVRASRTVNDVVISNNGRVYFGTIGSSLNYKELDGAYQTIDNYATSSLYPGYTITTVFCNSKMKFGVVVGITACIISIGRMTSCSSICSKQISRSRIPATSFMQLMKISTACYGWV